MISARALLLGLIALNLVALLWWTGQLAPLFGSPLEPQRLSTQIQPDMLRVVRPSPRAEAKFSPVVAGVIETAVQGDVRTFGAEPQASRAAGSLFDGVGSPAPEPRSVPGGSGPAVEPPPGNTVSADNGAGRANPVVQVQGATPDTLAPREAVTSGVARAFESRPPPPAPSKSAVEPAPSLQPARDSRAAAAIALETIEPNAPGSPEPGPLLANLESDRDISSTMACLRMRDLPYADYQTYAARLRDAGLEVQGQRTRGGQYVVYAGPLGNPEQAKAHAQELNQLGVRETHVMRSGRLRHAVSVGLLATRELAIRHRDTLAQQGIEGLAIAPMDPLGSRYELLASGPSSRLGEIVGFLGEGATISDQACR